MGENQDVVSGNNDAEFWYNVTWQTLQIHTSNIVIYCITTFTCTAIRCSTNKMFWSYTCTFNQFITPMSCRIISDTHSYRSTTDKITGFD